MREDTALAYFCNIRNPFYDRTSNNEQIKMQKMDAALLESKDGVRYKLHYANEPDLFVIRKEKVDKGRVTTTNCYYILGGLVFQAPLYQSVVSARLYNVLYSMNELFHDLQPNVRYSSTTGQYYWNFEEQETAMAAEEALQQKQKREQERRIAQEEMIQQSTRPPYSNEIQLHVDKLIYDMEVDTYGELRKRMEEKQLQLQQQQQTSLVATGEDQSELLDATANNEAQHLIKRTLSSAQMQGMAVEQSPQALKKAKLA